MTCRTSHEADEVPVFLRGVSVTLDVTDELSVRLTSGVETERGLDHLVLEVAVDSLRAADDLDAALFLEIVLSKDTSVGVRVVTADDDNRLDTEFFADLDTVIELPSLLQFGTTGTDDVETTGVAVLVDDIRCELLILAVNKTRRTSEEAVQLIVRIQRFKTVKETGDDVVTAGSLTSGENHTHVERLCFRLLTFDFRLRYRFHSNDRQTVRVREEFLDLLLVCNRLCFLAFYKTNRALQCYRHLRLIALTRNL